MDTPQPEPSQSFHAAIDRFLAERLHAKLDKLKDDDPERERWRAQFQRDAWLEDAALRVQQIQAVTHSLKPIHPNARGSNLYVEPTSLPALSEVGSHVLGSRFDSDVVGNAAALDVNKLLKLSVAGRSLLAALLADDADALQALHSDAAKAESLRAAFVGLVRPRDGAAATHALAKQLYWLTGSDASVDDAYVLLAPLYPTSLIHNVHADVQAARFGEANKAAREAWNARKAHDGVCVDYPDLAVQKMGGTKPQNISQLNSERGGVNYLLSSLPPDWRVSRLRLPKHARSVFDGLFGSRPLVWQTVRELRRFLTTNPPPNLATRERREGLIDTLVDEMVTFAAELHASQAPGWTLHTAEDGHRLYAKLCTEEQLWLDPLRATMAGEEVFAALWQRMDWPAQVGLRFGNWLNGQMKRKDDLPGLSVGEVEAREWKAELLTDEAGFKQQLREFRDQLAAPHYIPIRKTHAELMAERGDTP